MKISKKKIIIISIIAIILAVFFIPKIINPFQRSEAEIKRYLLKKIPLETSYDETREILSKEVEKYSSYDGTANSEKWMTRKSATSFCRTISWDKIEFKNIPNTYNPNNCDEKFFSRNLRSEIYLDNEYNFLHLSEGIIGYWLHVYFIFDENEKLIDLEVTKEESID